MAKDETGNAADSTLVHGAERRVRRREARFYDALRAVLATPEGRLVFGERTHGFLARVGVYRSTFDLVPTEMARRAGRQDVGHELLADLVRADEAAYLQMETEMRALARADAREADAAQRNRAEEKAES